MNMPLITNGLLHHTILKFIVEHGFAPMNWRSSVNKNDACVGGIWWVAQISTYLHDTGFKTEIVGAQRAAPNMWMPTKGRSTLRPYRPT